MNQPRLKIDHLAATGSPGATGGSSASANGELAIHGRVVTMAEIAGRLAAVRRLVVPAQAVVTPAVHDELRRKNISLVRAAAEPPPAGYTVRLCLVTAGGCFEPAPLAAALAGHGVQVQCSACECLLAATDHLAAEVLQEGTLGLLLTRHTAAALCLANRHRGVRAVSGADVAGVTTAVAAVGANLLVIDPAAAKSFQLRQITSEFCRSGVRPCPNVFREKLG